MYWSKYTGIRKILDDVYCLLSLGIDSNVYVIGNKEEIMLIDTGTGYSINYVINEIKQLGLNPKRIKYIVNTHCHIDHIGGDNYIREISENVEILVHKNDAVFMINGDAHVIEPTGLLGQEHIKPISVDRKLSEGDKIYISDYVFSVIHTPGHTIGSICLYDDEYKMLFSGDTVFLEGFGRYDFPTSNFNDLVKSIELLSTLNIKSLFPGHGEYATEGGDSYIKRNLSLIKYFE